MRETQKSAKLGCCSNRSGCIGDGANGKFCDLVGKSNLIEAAYLFPVTFRPKTFLADCFDCQDGSGTPGTSVKSKKTGFPAARASCTISSAPAERPSMRKTASMCAIRRRPTG